VGGPEQPLDLEAALDLVPCGLLRTDRNGVIVRVNATFCGWVGYGKQELVGRKLYDLLTVGARIFHQTHLAPLMQIQGSIAEVKIEVLHRDGQKIPVVINARRHAGPEPFSELALFVARDRDKYERELLQARRRLETLVEEEKARRAEAKDRALLAEQMMGIVSHDLRNPLQTIQMGALVLSRGEATPHQLGVLGRIIRAGERARRLIAELLDFTQARLGHGISVQTKPLDLHALVQDVLEELGQAFPGRELLHERAGEGPCDGDSERIAQLVGNLVGNAMAYGRADAPVTVRTVVDAAGFRVSVHNDGTPIPGELQSQLFEPMVRGSVANTATRSVGLGLFIVREIARAHRGDVAVHSTAEAGTTFTASFPRRREG
jgi:sigma-B regulation protein RsbU (phosphoserine phosphatase)